MNNRNDPGVVDDLAKKIVEHESNLEHCQKLIKKETLLLKRDKESLLAQMNQLSLKSYETHEFGIKIYNSTFVSVDDEELVPKTYKVSLGFRVNKSKIHEEGKCPNGCAFRSRQNLTVFKK